MTDWALAQTENPYVPFGWRSGGAKSLEEYHDYCILDSHRADAQERKEKHDKEMAQIRRLKRKELGENRVEDHRSQTRNRRDLMSQLGRLPIEERWEFAASDATHHIMYYPTQWIGESLDSMEKLSLETREALISRLSDRRKGPWVKFCEEMVRSC